MNSAQIRYFTNALKSVLTTAAPTLADVTAPSCTGGFVEPAPPFAPENDATVTSVYMVTPHDQLREFPLPLRLTVRLMKEPVSHSCLSNRASNTRRNGSVYQRLVAESRRDMVVHGLDKHTVQLQPLRIQAFPQQIDCFQVDLIAVGPASICTPPDVNDVPHGRLTHTTPPPPPPWGAKWST